MNTNSSPVVLKAQEYYDSDDADNFYQRVWGGEDIHVGIYIKPDESVRQASHRTVKQMAERVAHFKAGTKVLDIGAGYGGSARYLAREKNFHVACLNLSRVQNERNRRMNEDQMLASYIDVVDGSFESLPFEDASFSLVWSQDAILHSGNRKQVFSEVDRVLEPGGEFIFTDPMQKPGVDIETLQPVLDRIHLDSMGSIEEYRAFGDALNWSYIEANSMPENLIAHYSSILKELELRHNELKDHCSCDYLEKMKAGLRHWIEAGTKNALDWGILHFRKSTDSKM